MDSWLLPRAFDSAVDDHLRAWLFTVCRNLVMDEFRRKSDVTPRSHNVIDGRPSPAPGPAEAVETADSARAVLDALGGLPEREREVLHLRYRGGLSYREIAEVTGHSLSYVGVLIHTGMKRLKKTLLPVLDLDPGAPRAAGGAR